jgi:O-antigen/teichoic acid export membrane protein
VAHGSSLGKRAGSYNYYLIDQVVVSGANFLTSAIVARFLGIEVFGIFSLAWIMVQFVQSLQSALILLPMMSIGPKQAETEAQDYFAVVMVHQIIWTLGSAVLTYFGCLAAAKMGLGPEAERLALPLVASVLVTQMHEFLRRYNATINKPKRILLSDILRYGSLIATLLGVMLWTDERIDSGGVLYIIAATAALATIVLWPSAPTTRGAAKRFKEITRRHIRVSRWLTGSALLMWITSNFFALAAGWVLGTAAVGAIRAAQSLMSVTNLFFQAAEGFGPPTAARTLHNEGVSGLKRFVTMMTLIGLVVTVSATLALGLPGDFWLTLVFGPEYNGYGYLVWELALSFVLLAASNPLRFAYQAAEKTHIDFQGYILAALWTLATSYPLAQWFGLHGAVAGYLVGQAIMMGYLQLTYRGFLARHAVAGQR